MENKKKLTAKWNIKCLTLAIVLGLMLVFFIAYAASFGEIKSAFELATENYEASHGTSYEMASEATYLLLKEQVVVRQSIFFLSIPAFLIALAAFLDCLFRRHVSHILVTVLGCVWLFVFSLVMGSMYIQASGVFNGSSLFCFLEAIAAIALGYVYVKKALDGDTNLMFYIVAGVAFGLMFMAAYSTANVFDGINAEHAGSYWANLIGNVSLMVLVIALTVVSSSSDYDPNPIQLDELGNVIYSEE